MYLEMQHELISYPLLELEMTDAESSSSKQIKDIKKLLSQNIDLLIISPNESKPLTPIVDDVFKKGIPVIVLDRKTLSSNYTAYIGGNNYIIGREAAKYANRILKGKGTIVEITGSSGSSPSQERHKGFVDELENFPCIKSISSYPGRWDFESGRKAVNELVSKKIQFDLVFAHNDLMAMGANKEYELRKKNKRVYYIGIDGTPGPGGGIESILAHQLDATLLYQTGGSLAISAAWNILNQKSFSKENKLGTLIIDSSNIKGIKAQTDEILMLHKKIELSKEKLHFQVERFNNLFFWFACSLLLLISIIVIVILLFRAYRNKDIANKKLEHQKLETEKQNEEFKKNSIQLEETSQARLKFFTNIFHEFRTPLTRILGPLEAVLNTTQIPTEITPKTYNISDLDSAFISRCNMIIDRNIGNPQYGVEELSKDIGLSRVNVYRKIKHLTNLTVNEYIKSIRLNKSTTLLTQSGKNIAEIAFECGFSSPSYFTKCFKTHFKLTPTEYILRNSSTEG